MKFSSLSVRLFTAGILMAGAVLPAAAQVKLTQQWTSDTTLRTPESVLYDAAKNTLYVANINVKSDKADGDGFLSQVSTDGKVTNLKWVTGLDDPKGMGIHGNRLYVADITRLVEVDKDKGTVLSRVDAPGAVFLNDVAIDTDGTAYVSDTRSGKVYKFSKGKSEVWLSDTTMLKGVNGLWVEKGKLLVLNKSLRAIDLKTKAVQELAKDLPSGDGIMPDGKGNYIVSAWAGEIHLVDTKGQKQSLLDTRAEKSNTANFWYIAKNNLLVVPTFFKNTLVAYKVNY